jgi:hypothetical protein
MADQEKKKSPKIPARLVGVELFLVFFIGFVLVGYSVILCFILAVVGGITGGRLWSWWYSQDQTIDQVLSRSQELQQPQRGKKFDIKEAQKRRSLREQVASRKNLGWRGFFSRRQ